MIKIGILGGTFDPVHYGHLMLADQAASVYGLSKILFVPSGRPPHKDVNKITPSSQRVDMLKLAIEGNSLYEVSEAECDDRVVSYTYATLGILRGLYSQDTEFYYIIGSDVLNFISKFRNAAQVFNSCVLIASARPGADIRKIEEQADNLRKLYGARIVLLRFPEIEISSSLIREKFAGGGSSRYMLPDSVIGYINRHGLYKTEGGTALSGYWESVPEAEPGRIRTDNGFIKPADVYGVESAAGRGDGQADGGWISECDHENGQVDYPDVIDDSVIDRVSALVASKLDKKRYEHTLGVADIAADMAARLGADPKEAALAGLLHDYMRDAPQAELINVCESGGVPLTDYDRQLPVILHAPAGAIEAKRILGRACGARLYEAIAGHTTGREGMGLLAKIIFVADAVEPGRDFEAAIKAREMLFVKNGPRGDIKATTGVWNKTTACIDIKTLDETVLYLLDQQITHIVGIGRPLHPDTVLARNWMMNKKF